MPARAYRRFVVRVFHWPQQAGGVAAHVEQGQVGGLPIHVDATISKGSYGRDNDAGRILSKSIVAKSQVVQVSQREVIDHDVGGFGELAKCA